MSDEPQPLRLKPRPQSAGGGPSPPPPPVPPDPAPSAPEPPEGTSRLRLKPRLTGAEESLPAPTPAPLPPPPPPPAAKPFPAPEPTGYDEPVPDEVPKFKLRPKAAAPLPAPPPPPSGPAFEEPPPPGPPDPLDAPPSPGDLAPPPPPRSSLSLPPMSVLAAPPPPPPGGMLEPPPPPGGIPRLSLTPPPADKAAPLKGLQIRVAEGQSKGGSRPGMKPPVKPARVAPALRKRPALGLAVKAGIAVLVLAIAVVGVFSYKVFFPPPERVKISDIAPHPRLSPAEMLARATAAPGKVINSAQSAIAAHRDENQAGVDALATGQDAPTPTPTPLPASANDVSQEVMATAVISADVKVNNTPIDTSAAASPAFRIFVGNASIGGVFQGFPSKALINGRIIRAGQVIDDGLGIIFDRVDSKKKMIYFKDVTGAEVSKNY